MVTKIDKFFHGVQDFLRDPLCFFAGFQALQNNHEFIAGEPKYGIGVTYGAL